jgi:hypothetical protein
MEHPVDVQQCHSCACVFAHINAFIALVTLRYVPHPSIDSRSHASLSLGHVGLWGAASVILPSCAQRVSLCTPLAHLDTILCAETTCASGIETFNCRCRVHSSKQPAHTGTGPTACALIFYLRDMLILAQPHWQFHPHCCTQGALRALAQD